MSKNIKGYRRRFEPGSMALWSDALTSILLCSAAIKQPVRLISNSYQRDLPLALLCQIRRDRRSTARIIVLLLCQVPIYYLGARHNFLGYRENYECIVTFGPDSGVQYNISRSAILCWGLRYYLGPWHNRRKIFPMSLRGLSSFVRTLPVYWVLSVQCK